MKLESAIPLLLLLTFLVALTLGVVSVVFIIVYGRRQRRRQSLDGFNRSLREPAAQMWFLYRPARWLAIRSSNLLAVQNALRLHNAKPCSVLEGLSASNRLFIAPPINGWILVFGASLPDPGEDIDCCFRSVLNLSRKLGEVQFFCANSVLHEHAWVRAVRGNVIRAYAWAGQTLWNQGPLTKEEKQLGLRCYDYSEVLQPSAFSYSELIADNVDKVPMLASRWSIDPTFIDPQTLEKNGIAGEIFRSF